MQPFSLKRKRASGAPVGTLAHIFDDSTLFEEDDDVLARQQPVGRLALESAASVASRLKQDGILLAEAEKYNAAVSVWDRAIFLAPEDETLFEMKAQALNEAGLYFAAVQVGILSALPNLITLNSFV